MKIENKVARAVVSALSALYGAEPEMSAIQLKKTKKEFEGHLTLVVFPFLKMSRKSPEATAQEIGEYLENNQIIKIEYDPKLDFIKKIWDKDLHIWKEGATDEEITEHMATSVTKLLYEVLKLGCEVEINGKKHIQSLSDEKRKALNERKSGFDLAEELGAPITEVFWPFKDDGSDNVLMSAEDFKKMILKCFKYGEQCYIAAELLKAKRKITSTIEDFMTELNNVNSISLNNL